MPACCKTLVREKEREREGRGDHSREPGLGSARKPVSNPNPTRPQHAVPELEWPAWTWNQSPRHPTRCTRVRPPHSFNRFPQKETNTRPKRLPLFLASYMRGRATKFTDELAHAHGPRPGNLWILEMGSSASQNWFVPLVRSKMVFSMVIFFNI